MKNVHFRTKSICCGCSTTNLSHCLHTKTRTQHDKFYSQKLPGENLIQTMGDASGTVSLLISSQPEVLYDISSKLLMKNNKQKYIC